MVEQTKIAITLQDDSLVIMAFINNDYNGLNRPSTEENINAEINKAGFDAKSWRIIQDSDFIYLDRTFRNAWKDVGTIKVDMVKAREIHKDNLRMKRGQLFVKLDADYMKADEENDNVKKQEIRQKKQILRDITQHPGIELAQTPDELKRIWFE